MILAWSQRRCASLSGIQRIGERRSGHRCRAACGTYRANEQGGQVERKCDLLVEIFACVGSRKETECAGRRWSKSCRGEAEDLVADGAVSSPDVVKCRATRGRHMEIGSLWPRQGGRACETESTLMAGGGRRFGTDTPQEARGD